jgi:hypothetical protein
VHEATRTRPVLAFGIITAACMMLSPIAVQAQRPTVDAALATRARNACDAAAAKAGYNIMRRDNETHATTTITFPMHVRHGTEEADVTCTYDTHRGLATYSAFQAQRAERAAQRQETREETREARAQRICRENVNGRRGYRVESVGDPTQHGNNWDVPLRVRRNGRTNVLVTCRYNSATSKISLR